MNDAASTQRKYYSETAASYDERHISGIDEHSVALSWLAALIRLHRFDSLLDVGCGTGRCLRFLKEAGTQLNLKGLEPVLALREVAQQKGLTETEIVDGSALALPFEDASFDVVTSFGVLHHIDDHRKAVSEMCRVARNAVFISDCNNFGQGGPLARAVKQGLHAAGLWRAFDIVRTKGKGYHWSQGDGIYYSYSVFDDVSVLKRRFSDLHFMGTRSSNGNLYRTASHLAVFARKA
jgi:ubiquinone/menaquinone biosynthesis C-methylase UbiE